jgi:lipopolysaccharide export system permease protein
VLVFTGVIWLSQSLRVIDTVVSNGQSARVLLEFSLLLLPQVMAIVLPVSAFAATLYTINKLFGESELVAMGAAGMSRLALARPVALFGGAVMVVMYGVTTVAMPMSSRALRDQIALLRADIASGVLFEGQFLNPSPGLTVYVRQSDGTGEMRGVFVHDRRDSAAEVTYTAREALLSRTEAGPRLVMFDGIAQRFETATGSLSVLHFDSLVYDLAPFSAPSGERVRRPSERFFHDLIFPGEDALAAAPRGRLYAEGHEQISAPLYALVLPVAAMAGIVGGGFTRQGYGRRIAATAGLALAVRVAGIGAKALTTGAPLLWPLFYLPPLAGLIGALLYLEWGARLRPRPTGWP